MRKGIKIILLSVCAALCFQTTAFAACDYITENSIRIPVASAYTYAKTIGYFGTTGFLNGPEDIYIDNQDNLYIADTGNNRIVILDKNGKVKNKIEYAEGNKSALNAPSGIYAEDDGTIYIGDTNNQRILHVDANGAFIEEFTKPDSAILGEGFTFSSRKIAVTDSGYIYTIKDKSLMKIDAKNNFKGFIGATRLGFSIEGMLIRMFASRAQKQRLLTKEPPPYLSFSLAKDGNLYATTTDLSNGQIMKLDVTGLNRFPNVFYGEYSKDEEGNQTAPYFIDITANRDSIVTAVDQRNGKLYQYDKDGNLLCVFGGGLGNKAGQFSVPAAIETDSEGNIYVLDSQLGSITVYKPTVFADSIHNAVSLYSQGKYEQSKSAFEKILDIDGNYNLAYQGIARILVKEGKYQDAMKYYRIADDKSGYSTAFSKYRHEVFRNNFFLVFIITVALLAILYFSLIYLKRGSDGLRKKYSTGSVKASVFYFLPLSICMLFEPAEVCYIVKRERKRIRYSPLLIFMFLVVLCKIAAIYLTHYPLAVTEPQNTQLWIECATILVPLVTWAVAQYAVTAIFSGESKFGEIFTLSVLSMVPYVALSIPIALLSRILCLEEAGLYNLLLGVMWIWTAILMLRCLKSSNDYHFGKMILVALISLFAVVLIWGIILLMTALGGQFADFVKSVLNELSYAGERGL